jgi:hypothetical protein
MRTTFTSIRSKVRAVRFFQWGRSSSGGADGGVAQILRLVAF